MWASEGEQEAIALRWGLVRGVEAKLLYACDLKTTLGAVQKARELFNWLGYLRRLPVLDYDPTRL